MISLDNRNSVILVLLDLSAAPISDVIASPHLNYHLYADDTQLYFAFKTIDVNLAIYCVEKDACLRYVAGWNRTI